MHNPGRRGDKPLNYQSLVGTSLGTSKGKALHKTTGGGGGGGGGEEKTASSSAVPSPAAPQEIVAMALENANLFSLSLQTDTLAIGGGASVGRTSAGSAGGRPSAVNNNSITAEGVTAGGRGGSVTFQLDGRDGGGGPTHPSELGPLRPTGMRSRVPQSGTHIRRRPLSAAPRNVHRNSNSDAAAGAATSPVNASLPGPLDDASGSPVAQATAGGVAREGRETRPIKYDRRAAASPAPSRPPRGNRRRQAAGNVPPSPAAAAQLQPFSSQQSTEALGGAVQRQPSDTVLSGSPPRERRRLGTAPGGGARPPSGRRQGSLPAGHSDISAIGIGKLKPSFNTGATSLQLTRTGSHSSEIIRQYVSACRETGETPNPDWISAAQLHSVDDANDFSVNSGTPDSLAASMQPQQQQQMPLPGSSAATTKLSALSGRRPRLVTKENAAAVAAGGSSPQGTIGTRGTKSPATGRTGKVGAGGTAARRTGSVGRLTTANRMHAIGKAGGPRGAKELALDQMQTFCDQQAPLLRHKMDILRERREDVSRALNTFLSSYVSLAASPTKSDAAESGGGGSGDDSISSTPRARHSGLGGKSALQTKAKTLTAGIQTIQGTVGRLLLTLGQYAQDVRKPLGTTLRSGDNSLAPSRRPSFDVAGSSTTNNNVSSSNNNNNMINPSNSVNSGTSGVNPLRPFVLPGIPTMGSGAYGVGSSASSPTGAPRGFVDFLRQQETEIATQLEDAREHVQRVLRADDQLHIEDATIFQTPLFLSDGVVGSERAGGAAGSAAGAPYKRHGSAGVTTTGDDEGGKSPSTPRGSGAPARSTLSPRKKTAKGIVTPRTPRGKAVSSSSTTASGRNLTRTKIDVPPASSRSNGLLAFTISSSGGISQRSADSGAVSKSTPVLKLTLSTTPTPTPRGHELTPREDRLAATMAATNTSSSKAHTRTASVGAGKKKIKRASSASKKGARGDTAVSNSATPSRNVKMTTVKKDPLAATTGSYAGITKNASSSSNNNNGNTPTTAAPVDGLQTHDLLEAREVWKAIRARLSTAAAAAAAVPSPPKVYMSTDALATPAPATTTAMAGTKHSPRPSVSSPWKTSKERTSSGEATAAPVAPSRDRHSSSQDEEEELVQVNANSSTLEPVPSAPADTMGATNTSLPITSNEQTREFMAVVDDNASPASPDPLGVTTAALNSSARLSSGSHEFHLNSLANNNHDASEGSKSPLQLPHGGDEPATEPLRLPSEEPNAAGMSSSSVLLKDVPRQLELNSSTSNHNLPDTSSILSDLRKEKEQLERKERREAWQSKYLKGTAEEKAVTLVAAFFRRRRACKEYGARISERAYDREMEEEGQLRDVLDARLKRFLLSVVRRRRTRKLVQQAKEKKAGEKTGSPLRRSNSLRASSPTATTTQTSRERFERAREQRRKANDDSGTPLLSSPPTLDVSLAGAPLPSIEALPLLSSGATTFDIRNYNKDADGFEVAVLHRLLSSPQTLLFTVRTVVERFPTKPPMGYAKIKPTAGSTTDTGSVDRDSGSQGRAETPSRDAKGAAGPPKDRVAAARVQRRRTAQQKRGVFHLPHNALRPFLPYEGLIDVNSTFEGSFFSSHGTGSPVTTAAPSPCASSPHVFLQKVGVPLSVRYASYVDPNELRHAEPVSKDLQRPFERWGCALALCRRVFCAAAIYAWKLIFSHTPHDDYKQQQLQSAEERRARVQRVDERNRMILACYCVRSEREWLREAAKDLSFVGQIWNPKKSMDPNDKDLDKHCRETYEFVEDFLYQCFPTATSLDDIPSFLMGAGLYFLLKEVFHINESEAEQLRVARRLTAPLVETLLHTFHNDSDSAKRGGARQGRQQQQQQHDHAVVYNQFTALQQYAIQRYEVADLLHRLSDWFHTHEDQRLAAAAAMANSQNASSAPGIDSNEATLRTTNDNMFNHSFGAQESVEAFLVRSLREEHSHHQRVATGTEGLGSTQRRGSGANYEDTFSGTTNTLLSLSPAAEPLAVTSMSGTPTPTAANAPGGPLGGGFPLLPGPPSPANQKNNENGGTNRHNLRSQPPPPPPPPPTTTTTTIQQQQQAARQLELSRSQFKREQEKLNVIVLAQVPQDVFTTNHSAKAAYKDAAYVREKEEVISNAFTDYVQKNTDSINISDNTFHNETNLSSRNNRSVDDELKNQLTVLFPQRFLTVLAEKLSFELFGLRLDLEVCEDLDIVA